MSGVSKFSRSEEYQNPNYKKRGIENLQPPMTPYQDPHYYDDHEEEESSKYGLPYYTSFESESDQI